MTAVSWGGNLGSRLALATLGVTLGTSCFCPARPLHPQALLFKAAGFMQMSRPLPDVRSWVDTALSLQPHVRGNKKIIGPGGGMTCSTASQDPG